MRSVARAERHHRVGVRHFLARPAPGALAAVRGLTALHSSDPATVYLSVWARCEDFEVPDLEQALYDERTLVRMYGMRRTLWVVPREAVSIIDNSSTKQIAERERRRTAKLFEDGGVTNDGEAWLQRVIPKTLGEIRSRGEMLTRDVTRSIPELDGKIELRNQKGDLIGSTGLASRVILQLAMESRVVRARPAGTWISGQYRWADMEDWLGDPIPETSPRHARAELVRSWLHSFGPATETDLKWWTGWKVSQVRAALSDVEASEVDLDGQVGYIREDDLEPVSAPEPWAALLPSLDPTTMGWKDRTWYLGDHGDRLFDRNGNAGPTVWVDGRVVGGWAQREDGEIVYELFEDVGSEARDAIEARAVALRRWMSDITVTPRFRSPHDKDLTR